MLLLRKKLAVVLGAAMMLAPMLAFSAPAFAAANPSGTGLPSQSCEQQPTGPNGFNSGGFKHAQDTYNETSQYDVACYQLSH